MNSRHFRLARAEAAALYRLRAFGRLALDDAPRAADGAAARPRSLALLVLLAAAGEAGMPRDKVLLFLWPESNTQRARNSLHQTLYAIRRHLGQEAVLAGIPNLQLNPRSFTCDLWDFDAALASGDHDAAIALYAGPFLDGFALPGLPEFEQWVEEQRQRLARRYVGALEASAMQASAEGHHRLAIERWETLAALEPLSARPALGLIRAFVSGGNRAAALGFAREYEARIRRGLGTDPDPAVSGLIEELRGRGCAGDAAALETTDVPVTLPPAPEAIPATAPAQSHDPTRTASKLRRLRIVIAVLLVLELVMVGALWRSHRSPEPGAMSPDLVAVLPFTVVGSPDVQYLDTGMVDLLTTNLEGAGSLRSVDPRALLGWVSQQGSEVRTPEEAERVADRFGAGLYLLGSVVESGGRLRVTAALYDRRHEDGPVASAAQQGAASDLFQMVDRLTSELLAGAPNVPGERLARVAAATTGSIEALKRYLAGERDLRAGEYARALESYQEAVAIDTSFALAHYRLSVAAEWLGQDRLSRDAAAAAVRLAGRLSEHDRFLVEALAARRQGRSADAERLYRRVVTDYPDDVEAWFQLAQVLFHANPLRGRSSVEARHALEEVLALDPGNEEALVYLARIAFIEGRRQEVDTLVRRVLELTPSIEVLELRAFRAFALGDREAHKRVTRELLDRPPEVPSPTALQVAVSLDDVDGVDRFARLLRGERYSADVRGLSYRLLARVAAARGRWREARAQLDTARQFDPTAALELRSLLAVLPFLQVPAADLLAVRGELEAWRPEAESARETSHSAAHAGLHRWIRLYRLGLVSSALGDTARALRHAVELQGASLADRPLEAEAVRAFALGIRSRVAAQSQDPAEALTLLDQVNWELVETAFESEALHRFHRAELLHALDRHEEAIDWYRTIAERATYELVYLSPAQWRLGAIHARRGERERSAQAYARVARLWHEADAPLQPIVAQARERSGRR